MTKAETALLFALIKSLFPRDEAFRNATPDMIVAWAEMLADIPFENAKAAVKAAVTTSPFPPSIAEIREYATRLNAPRRLTAEEAWGVASEAMKLYGLNLVLKDGFVEKKPEESKRVIGGRTYRYISHEPCGYEYEAKRHLPQEVWNLMKHFGYKEMYLSENPDVVRGQFMRAWGMHDQEAKERRVFGSIVPEFARALSETMSRGLLDEGEDE